MHTDAIVKRVTKESWDKTKSVICLPTLPYGVDCNLIDFPLTIHVKQSTLDLMITEIVSSLVHHDIKKILDAATVSYTHLTLPTILIV